MIDNLAEALYAGECRWNTRNLPELPGYEGAQDGEIAKAWRGVSEARKEGYRARVRAVLTALRTLEPEIEKAAVRAVGGDADCLCAWEAAIAAILTEEPAV